MQRERKEEVDVKETEESEKLKQTLKQIFIFWTIRFSFDAIGKFSRRIRSQQIGRFIFSVGSDKTKNLRFS